MSTRFHLRFDGGARDGELVPVPRSGLLVGRRQGNDLRLDAASVSGRHALLRPDGDLLRLEDMGSTNGTRVDGEKVETAALRHAQRVVFGDVPFEVVDASAVPSLEQTAATPSPAVADPEPSVGFDLEDEIELGSSEPAPRTPDSPPTTDDPTSRTQVLGERSGAPAPASMPAKRIPSELVEAPTADAFAADPSFAEEAVHTVDDALLERTRSSSAALPIVVGLLVLGGAAAAWFLFLRGDPETGGAPVSAALARDGNLLTGGDLEDEPEGFLQTLDGSIELFGETWAASTGAVGLGGELLPGDRLLAHTSDVAVRAGQEWSGVADLRASEGLDVALGLELFATDGSRSVLAWSAPSAAVDAWGALQVDARVRPGFDRARLWVAAGPFDGPEGVAAELALDDLGLVPGTEEADATVELGAFELALWRPDRRGLALYHAFAPLLTVRTGDGSAPARPGARMSLDTGGTHPRVELSGAPGPRSRPRAPTASGSGRAGSSPTASTRW